MKGKGLDTLVDDITGKTDNTDLDGVVQALLHPRRKHSPQPSEQRIKDIKNKV